MIVDGRTVAAEGTVLDACRRVGVDVPAFCVDPALSVGGHCRSCLVEVDGRFVAACATPARESAVVRTDTPALAAYRRDLGELLRAEAPAVAGPVGRTLAAWGVTGERYTPRSARPDDASGPYLRASLDACILCRRCARACDEIQGQEVFSVTGRGPNTELTWGSGTWSESDCVTCGACVAQCPTGALSDVDRERLADRPDWRATRTTCGYCGVGCQLLVRHDAERVVQIDGADLPPNHGHLCVKGRYAHGFVRHPDRLTTPLVRVDGVLVPATWDQAFARILEGFRAAEGKVAGLSSSRCTNEENYLFQKWIRSVWGTNSVDCCARVCHAPTAAGMRVAFGTGAATNSWDDLERADLLMVVGSNATVAHPVTGARVRQAAVRGTGLVVVDPRRTELAAIADVHLQLQPGTNVPLLNSMAHVLVSEQLVDLAFLRARVEGWEAFEQFVADQSPERWEPVTGVPAALVRQAARLYGRAERPYLIHGLGVTEHFQGSEGVMALCNLALLCGAVGREGVGVNPLRGQNNVQGAADMGCQPDLWTGYQSPEDPAVRARFARVWSALPSDRGLRIPEMYAAARAGQLRALYVFGEDVVQTDPDTDQVLAALDALDFLVVQELFLSQTATRADVVLPGASFLEKDGTFTNGERRVSRVRRTVSSPGGARPDLDIFWSLFEATGRAPVVDAGRCTTHAERADAVLAEIGEVWPGFAGLSFAAIEAVGLQWPVPAPGHPGTERLHADRFPIGKGRLSAVAFAPSPNFAAPEPPGAALTLTLTTGRVLEHYNTGSMTRRTPNQSLVPEDILEIHPIDAAPRGIVDGGWARVENAEGTIRVRAHLTERVRPGVVFLSFHQPDSHTNTLVGAVEDRVSACPEYKVVSVTVRAG